MLNPNHDRNHGSKGGKTDCFPVQDISQYFLWGDRGYIETSSVFLWSGGHGSKLCTADDAVLICISKSLRQIVVPWVKAFQMTFMYPWRRGIFWTPMLIIKTVSFEFFFHFVFAHFFQSFSQWNVMGWNPTWDLAECRIDVIFYVSGKRRQAQKQRAARVTRNGRHAWLARHPLLALAFASRWLWIRAISNFIVLIPSHRIYKMLADFSVVNFWRTQS